MVFNHAGTYLGHVIEIREQFHGWATVRYQRTDDPQGRIHHDRWLSADRAIVFDIVIVCPD